MEGYSCIVLFHVVCFRCFYGPLRQLSEKQAELMGDKHIVLVIFTDGLSYGRQFPSNSFQISSRGLSLGSLVSSSIPFLKPCDPAI